MKNPIAFMPFLKQVVPILLFSVSLAFVQGCAQYHLKMKDDDPEQKPYESRTIHAYAWGKLYDPSQITTDCNTETGINDVMVHRYYYHDLASVFTFGMWMPIEIQWRCQPGPGETIDLR